MVEDLKNATARRGAHLVRTRLVEAERETVQQYDAHAHPLKPRSNTGQESSVV